MKIEGVQDHYFPDPEKCDTVDCGVCGAQMIVERNLTGPTSYIMSISGSERRHDSFHCPHYYEFWHMQVKKLFQLARETPSPSLKKLYEEDIREFCRLKNTQIGNS